MRLLYKSFCCVLAVLTASALLPLSAYAQGISLPAPAQRLELSKPYTPLMIKGLKVHPQQPFTFDFIVDTGDAHLEAKALQPELIKLIKYFMAALTVPEQQMWVNLSPYEKNRMIPSSLGQTALGRDLLAQDYILKQLTASLTYPEQEMGKRFWAKIYKQAGPGHSMPVPVHLFNKVWIVPDKAEVYEHDHEAVVVKSHLKVMTQEDYLAMRENRKVQASGASEAMRQIILPALEREINEGAYFANLRQMYQAMILATWYKLRLKQSILSKVYVDQDKTKGIVIQDPQADQKIYQRYLEAFKKGVYNYIKEDVGAGGNQGVARKYVSGGYDGAMLSNLVAAGLVLSDRGGRQLRKGLDVQVNFRTDTPEAEGGYLSPPTVTTIKQLLNINGEHSIITEVASIDLDTQSPIRRAEFKYDAWGQIAEVLLHKGQIEGDVQAVQIPLPGNRIFHFSYKNGVPQIWTDTPTGPWIFSGYWLQEQEVDGTSQRSYVTIKSFGNKYFALESDMHHSAYHFLRAIQNQVRQTGLDLLLFDLHHDNYYSLETEHNKELNLTNWVRKAKKAGLIHRAVWIHPSWYVPMPYTVTTAQRGGIINTIVNGAENFHDTADKVLASIDFDYISSSTSYPEEHLASKEEIDLQVERILYAIETIKNSLIAINFNRSAFGISEQLNYSPMQPSNYILNAFVSRAALSLGVVQLTKVKQPFSPLSALLETHADSAMAVDRKSVQNRLTSHILMGLTTERIPIEQVEGGRQFGTYAVQLEHRTVFIKFALHKGWEPYLRLMQSRLGPEPDGRPLVAMFGIFHAYDTLGVVQEGVQPVNEVLKEKIRHKDWKGVEDLIKDFFQLQEKLLDRHLLNRDWRLDNYGVGPDGHVVLIDVGNLTDLNASHAEVEAALDEYYDILSRSYPGSLLTINGWRVRRIFSKEAAIFLSSEKLRYIGQDVNSEVKFTALDPIAWLEQVSREIDEMLKDQAMAAQRAPRMPQNSPKTPFRELALRMQLSEAERELGRLLEVLRKVQKIIEENHIYAPIQARYRAIRRQTIADIGRQEEAISAIHAELEDLRLGGDSAQRSYGGIDLSAKNLGLQVSGQAQETLLSGKPATNLSTIQGLYPVILKVVPVKDLLL